MFRIHRDTNSIQALPSRSLRELGFYERQHLQEWLANYPTAFGEDEELLIIQKEFDGFGETNERLDLLALDKDGNLVIIENKLDDSGRDVVWQSLKYASYASSLSKAEIVRIYQSYLTSINDSKDAEAEILEFTGESDFDDLQLNQRLTQRIFIVAGNFRKEVTSTAVYLLQYGVRLHCFQVSAYGDDDAPLLRIDQIIPTVQDQEYAIRMAEKVKEEATARAGLSGRQQLREQFWRKLLPVSNDTNQIFSSISPSRASWIAATAGISHTSYIYAIGKDFARVELYVDRPASKRNEVQQIYGFLVNRRDQIEAAFGAQLIWEPIPNKRASRIKYERHDMGLYDESRWDEAVGWLVEVMQRFEQALREPLVEVRRELKI